MATTIRYPRARERRPTRAAHWSRTVMVVALVSLMAGLSGCRSSDGLQAQEAEARLRTCIGTMEAIVGLAIVKGTEPENPGRPGTDWQVLVAEPDDYYVNVTGSVSVGSFLHVAETGRVGDGFRSNRREYLAGCPAIPPS